MSYSRTTFWLLVCSIRLVQSAPTTELLAVSSSSLKFEAQPIYAASIPQILTFANGGSAPLRINSIVLEGPSSDEFHYTTSCPSLLAVSESCAVAVVFKPHAVGRTRATLAVRGDSKQTSVQVLLVGTATTPVLAVSPQSLTLSSQTKSGEVLLSNSGTLPITLRAIQLQGRNAAAFHITSNCDTILPAREHCTVTISAVNSSLGSQSALLVIHDDTSASPELLLIGAN